MLFWVSVARISLSHLVLWKNKKATLCKGRKVFLLCVCDNTTWEPKALTGKHFRGRAFCI